MESTLIKIINGVSRGLIFLIFIRLLIEIITAYSDREFNTRNSVLGFLFDFTEPFFKPFKKILPSFSAGIDTSPIFAIGTIEITGNILNMLVIAIF